MTKFVEPKSVSVAEYRAMSSKKVKVLKYRNKITDRDGIRFHSIDEANRYDELKLLVASRVVKYFLRQVALHLPGGVKLVVDFQVFYRNDSVEYEDVKGAVTAGFLVKKKIAESAYPIEIKIVKMSRPKKSRRLR